MRLYFINFFVLLIFSSIIGAKDYYVYCAAESEDEVALIRFDGKKAYVEKRIQVGVWPVEIEGPHGITISPEGDYWYLSMAHGMPYGHLYKYETGSDDMVDRVELGLFPASMEISSSTGLLYVVNFNLHGGHEDKSTVSIVDPEEMIEIERVETGVMPHGSRLLKNFHITSESFSMSMWPSNTIRIFTLENLGSLKNVSMNSFAWLEVVLFNAASMMGLWELKFKNL